MGFLGFRAFLFVGILFQSVSFAGGARETAAVVAIRKARPAVVAISTARYPGKDWARFLGEPHYGYGSGVIVDPRGYILTNNHVVDGSDFVHVTLPDSMNEYQALIIGQFPEGDLAVLKIIPDRPLPTVKIGTSSDLELGEKLIAIGYPMGMGLTVTEGILSARIKYLYLGGTALIPEAVQTDAAINPGNSGGIIINLDGEVVAITVAMHSKAQGIAFGLPIDTVRKQLAHMIRQSNPNRSQVGIQAVVHGNPTQQNLYVDSLDAKADAEGFIYGDRILRVNGKPVLDEADFEFSLLGTKPGDRVSVQVDRCEDEATLSVAIQKMESMTVANGQQP